MTLRARARQLGRIVRSLKGVGVGGTHFALPIGPKFEIEEPWMTEIMRRMLPVFEGAFIDVGANIGQTLLQLRAIDTKRRYLGFEPNSTCASYILELIRINGLARTDIIPAACGLGYGISKLHFYQDSEFDASASLVSDFRTGSRVTKTSYVLTAPIGECLSEAEIDNIGIIKIDVEGYEANVIEALEAQLAKARPCLIVEVLPVYSAENVARLSGNYRIEAVLERASYSMFRVMKSANLHLNCLEPIDTLGIHGDMRLVDYVFLPNEFVEPCLRSEPHCV